MGKILQDASLLFECYGMVLMKGESLKAEELLTIRDVYSFLSS